MFKLIDRYILKEHLKSFLFGLGVFLSIFLVDLLMELIELIVTKNVPFRETARLFFYAIPSLLVLVMPMAMLLSTLVVFGQMSSQSEVTALKACGISLYRLIIPVMIMGGGVSFLSFFTNEYLVPRTNELRQDILRRITFKRPLPKISENVFFDAGEDRTFFVHRYDEEHKKMEDVIVYEFVHGPATRFPRIIVAEQCFWSGNAWTFDEGIIYRFDKEGGQWDEIRFDNMSLPVKTTYGDWKDYKSKRPHEMSFSELQEHIAKMKKIGIDVRPALVELYTKLSLPFASLFFVLIGAPLAMATGRSGKSIGVGISILVIF
ncbi:MAG: LptF/LptG family permease, partial [Deltaproteobacteria bacterium]|nr:LptF/LptG family permease [Deltaproteobacteria bacterium]